MNKAQWSILIAALVVLSASILFPPWLFRCESGFSYSAGYHFVAQPPSSRSVCPSSTPLPAPLPSVVRNVSRQAVQIVVLILLALGLVLLLKTPRTNFSVVLAITIACGGVIGLLYLGLMIRFEL